MKVLDPCCGSKMFWFDKDQKNAVFGDKRKSSTILCDGRSLEINPTINLDFRALPFNDASFSLVIFDPPHLERAGTNSWLAQKYGKLEKVTWQADLKKGFSECFRVLKTDGVLIFKWNEVQISVTEILKLTDQSPLFGHKSGKRANTHWICFMKEVEA